MLLEEPERQKTRVTGLPPCIVIVTHDTVIDLPRCSRSDVLEVLAGIPPHRM
jgi:hypothetical protein